METTRTTYTLTKTTLKNGKYHYVVIDNNGNIISERKSNREYVACTIDGGMFFGRLDLIGKGDHARACSTLSRQMTYTYEQMANYGLWRGLSIERLIECKNEIAKRLNGVETIAYLNNN